MSAENEKKEKMEEDIASIKSDMKILKTAMLGDEYGNNGYKQRLENVERKTKDFEKKGWMVYGGSIVVGFIIAKGKAILALLTGN